MNINQLHNPPAFPRGETPHQHGMSLRDWFAGQALIALAKDYQTSDWSAPGMAKDAYQIADAMLAEREKEK